MSTAIILGGITLTLLGLSQLELGMYRPIATVLLTLILSFIFSIITYRTFLFFWPIPTGNIRVNSKEEFSHHIHLLFYLVFFIPVLKSHVLPLPISKLILLGLGTKMGRNSYSSGSVQDGLFVEIGEDCIVGHQAALIPHALENSHLSYQRIKIGNNVTIGAGAIVFQGVVIDDDALVSANAVVLKGTHIGPGEIWGGVPAKLISKKRVPTLTHLKQTLPG